MIDIFLRLYSSSDQDFPCSLPHESHWPALILNATTAVTQDGKYHLWLGIHGPNYHSGMLLVKAELLNRVVQVVLCGEGERGELFLGVNYQSLSSMYLPFRNCLFVQKDEDPFLLSPSPLRLPEDSLEEQ